MVKIGRDNVDKIATIQSSLNIEEDLRTYMEVKESLVKYIKARKVDEGLRSPYTNISLHFNDKDGQILYKKSLVSTFHCSFENSLTIKAKDIKNFLSSIDTGIQRYVLEMTRSNFTSSTTPGNSNFVYTAGGGVFPTLDLDELTEAIQIDHDKRGESDDK